MGRRERGVLLAAFVVIALVVGLLGSQAILGRSATNRTSTPPSSTSSVPSIVISAKSVTGTSVNSSNDVFFSTSCVITGVGDFALLIVSDSTGAPVNGESINAAGHLGCGSMPQVVYLNNFTVEQKGWLTPVWPSRATPAGALNFTVIYEGKTYNFSAGVSPIGSSCVTLHVPSGNVTTTTVMNGEGSFCWQ